jgi:peptide/nickel transport system ATP-binding protein
MNAAIEVVNLRREFGTLTRNRRVIAVDDVTFSVSAGSVLGIVGESGCGKSTLARMILGLLPPTAGTVLVDGRRLFDLDRRARARLIQPVFQDPFASLNPRRCIKDIVGLPLGAQGTFSSNEINRRVAQILERVGLSAEMGERLPAQLSGGQRQRVMIAMALMCDPELLVADEPTTALDVTVQAQILRLLASLKRDFGLSILLITHDLGVVARVADRVSVMYAGEVIERASTARLFRAPQHPYTRGLLSCVPVPGRVRRDRPLGAIPGTVPTIAPGFAGCAFRSRCAHADATCAGEIPRRAAGGAHERLEACLVDAQALRHAAARSKLTSSRTSAL